MNVSGSTDSIPPRRRLARAIAPAAVAFCALFAAACSTPREYPCTEDGVRQLLQDFADEYIEDTDSVGIIAGVILPDDSSLIAVSGQSDVLDPEKELSPDTIFPIGSLTKNMVFEMAGELERTGEVDFDTPLKDCPGLDLPPEYDSITVRDLLLHRSGLPRESYTLTNIWPVISAEIWDSNVYENFCTREGLIETLSNSECRSAVSQTHNSKERSWAVPNRLEINQTKNWIIKSNNK